VSLLASRFCRIPAFENQGCPTLSPDMNNCAESISTICALMRSGTSRTIETKTTTR
jgi:hypothetical protein